MTKQLLNLTIKGTVQRVFYRLSAKRQAQALRLKGYVKNLPDGNVRLIAEGEKTDLEELLKWCWQGPSGARVSDIDIIWKGFENKFDTFTIDY